LAGGINVYAYGKNPIGWIDPLGLAGDETLKPGPFATESIPARGPERNFTLDERQKINAIGIKDGCHTCGAKEPGTKSGDLFQIPKFPTHLTRMVILSDYIHTASRVV